jgi:AdoMet-dependent rRNA methyltransferase SPB1
LHFSGGRLVLTRPSWLKSRHTTPDVVTNCQDLKVLGKGDFKLLMKWRLAIRLETGLDVKADTTDEATEEITVEPMDEDEMVSEEVSHSVLEFC